MATKEIVSKMLGKKNANDQNVFLSRWGFHPCDQDTFLKLKRLKKIYWEAVRVQARWNRWARKRPENQFYWEPRTSNSEKRKRSDRPIPEPIRCPIFGHGPWMGDCYLKDKGIDLDFENARMPKTNPDEVKPLRMSLKEIDEMLEKAEKWYAERN